MRNFVLFAFLSSLSLGAATPLAPALAPANARVIGVSFLGSGCPAGSASGQLDASGTRMEVAFSQFIVKTGPGTSADEWRKNCKLTLNMAFDEGYQFSTLVTGIRGYAQIPAGSRGRCTNSFSFTGSQGQSSYDVFLDGPREGPFDLSSNPDNTVWSSCGGTTAILNMNAQCNISPTQQTAIITISPHVVVNVAIQWRRC